MEAVHDPDTTKTGDKGVIRAALAEARERTWLVMSGVDDEALGSAACDFLSPPVWDLGHIGNFEELWLVQQVQDAPESRPGYNDIYNAFEHPRHERPQLSLLDREGCRAYMAEVRERALAGLDAVDTSPDAPRLTKDGFVYWMLVLHEHQHQETLLQSMQMRAFQGAAAGQTSVRAVAARTLPTPRAGIDTDAWVDVPEAVFTMGRPHGAGVYDNEAGPHDVHVPRFRMARYPVTCGQYLDFVEAGGYDDAALWSERGRAWLEKERHHAPASWRQVGGTWHRTGLTGDAPVAAVADEVLCHVSFFEAEAYAHWRGARLPTEAEWERACRADAGGQTSGRNPWGDADATTEQANIDQLGWGPARAGAYPEGASPLGVEHMIGDVWEWCDSGFEAYPGFEAFPYRHYSEVFFGGDFRMLRGGSWAARSGCAHGTFRNWDHPYRRQVFTGIRLAADA